MINFDTFANPTQIAELVGIADGDIMRGIWRPVLIQPLTIINELRNNVREAIVHTANIEMRTVIGQAQSLAKLAIAAVAIGELKGTSDTIRFVFASIEKIKFDSKEVNEAFLNSFQLMALAALPMHRKEVVEAVYAATGIGPHIVK